MVAIGRWASTGERPRGGIPRGPGVGGVGERDEDVRRLNREPARRRAVGAPPAQRTPRRSPATRAVGVLDETPPHRRHAAVSYTHTENTQGDMC